MNVISINDSAPSAHADTKITLQNVSKTFLNGASPITALDDVSLTIDEGEFFCLLGDSGCGKSTLLELIAGFERPSIGAVLVDGEAVLAPSHRRGVVFQTSSLLPWLTVRQNIGLGLKIRHAEGLDAPVRAIMAMIGLEGFAEHYPRQLSGGMAQRVAIARALVNEPDVLLFDEPFSALDSFTRKRLQGELVRLWRRRRFTAVFVTHDIGEAVTLGTRIALMTPRPGRIAALFQLPLQYPRDPTSPEFFRISSMVTKEFLSLDRDGVGGSEENTTEEEYV